MRIMPMFVDVLGRRMDGGARMLRPFKAKTSRNSSFTRKHPPLPAFAAGASAVLWNRLSDSQLSRRASSGTVQEFGF
jgi:hypothetical protein